MPNPRKLPNFSQRFDAPALGLLGFLASFIGSWVPPLWADEVATIVAARRSLGELLVMLQSVDAVHGLYYLFMHAWGSMFGFSDLSVRLPSAIAIGLACYGTVRFGSRGGSRFIGCMAGVVLAVLPRMVWAGSEARQYAFTAAMLVALILVLDRGWQHGRRVDWIAYILVAVVGIHLFMFFALAVLSLAAAAVFARRRPLATVMASLLAVLISLPFVGFVTTQKAQVSWIPERSVLQHLGSFVVHQFFFINADDRPGAGYGQPMAVLLAVTVLGVLLTAIACVGVVSGLRLGTHRTMLAVVLSVLLVPISCLLIAGALIQPVYVLRYLTFTAPAFALLVALGADFLRSRSRQLVPAAVAIIVLCSIVPQVTIKTLVKDEMSGISESLSEGLRPADAIFYDSPRAKIAHPVAVEGVNDLSMDRSPVEAASLWGTLKPMSDVDFAHRGRVWVIGEWNAMDLSRLLAAGCQQQEKVVSYDQTLIRFDCP